MAKKEEAKEEVLETTAPVEEAPVEAPAEEVTEEKFAKAGKKSKKHIEEVKAEEERQARKAEKAAEPEKKVGPKPITRSRLERRGKNYRKANEKIEKGKAYSLEEAVKLAVATSPVKFDATLEMHFRLGVDGRHADQQVRGAMVLPHGTGKSKKVLVFAKGPKAEEAQAAGADFVGAEDMAEKIKNENWFEFDAVVATPDMMGVVGRLGKILGPRGLMPNPKSGTVTMDLTKALEDIKAGKVEYRLDKSNIIHCIIGKKSFTEEQLAENANALIQAIAKAKPAAAKGQYFKSITITSTMSPGVKINPATVIQ